MPTAAYGVLLTQWRPGREPSSSADTPPIVLRCLSQKLTAQARKCCRLQIMSECVLH